MTKGIGVQEPADPSGKSSGPTPESAWVRTLVFSEVVVGAGLRSGKNLGMSFGECLSALQTWEHHRL